MGVPAQGSFVTPRPIQRAWGQLLTLKGEKPAAGANWQVVMPGAYITRIVSMHLQFQASAQVANRLLGLQETDGAGNVPFLVRANHVIAANVTAQVTALPFAFGITGEASASQVFTLPDVLLPPGFTIEGANETIQTEDQFSAPVLLVEQFEQDQHRHLAELAAEVHEILKAREALTIAAS